MLVQQNPLLKFCKYRYSYMRITSCNADAQSTCSPVLFTDWLWPFQYGRWLKYTGPQKQLLLRQQKHLFVFDYHLYWAHVTLQFILFMCLKNFISLNFKGIVHPKMKILSSFTHPQVVLSLYEFWVNDDRIFIFGWTITLNVYFWAHTQCACFFGAVVA